MPLPAYCNAWLQDTEQANLSIKGLEPGGAQLRPHDARMWCAMGQCYENEALGLDDAAVRCYRRAHLAGDREGAPSGSALLLELTAVTLCLV